MKIIHITDPHVRPVGQSLYGMDTGARLAAVIDDVNARHADADLVAITGDLTHYGEPDAYAQVAKLVAQLRVPFRLMLGNHDQRPAFREVFRNHPVDENGFVQFVIDAPGKIGRLLFLDTHEADRVGGHLCAKRLGWLQARLSEARETPVTIFQHHPPLRFGVPHFDNICMADPEPYMRLLRNHPGGVRHVFLGHIHVPLTGVFAGGIPFTAGRGCSHQLVLDMQRGNIPWASGLPNYNIVMLSEDDLFIHSFDMIGVKEIGIAEAPTGP